MATRKPGVRGTRTHRSAQNVTLKPRAKGVDQRIGNSKSSLRPSYSAEPTSTLQGGSGPAAQREETANTKGQPQRFVVQAKRSKSQVSSARQAAEASGMCQLMDNIEVCQYRNRDALVNIPVEHESGIAHRTDDLQTERVCRMQQNMAVHDDESIKATSSGPGSPKTRKRPLEAVINRTRPKKIRLDIASPEPATALDDQAFNILCTAKPQYLRLSQITIYYQVLQKRVSSFTKTWFSYQLSPDAHQGWPLHQLRTRYPSLYVAIKYIASVGPTGWRHFLTSADARPHLVMAIISEWLTQRVFNHTAFGLPEQDIQELENLDRYRIHYDPIVRTKRRAESFTAILERAKETPDEYAETMQDACVQLTRELLMVLQPLLESELADLLDGDTPTKRKQWAANTSFDAFTQEILDIVRAAANLHHSIRLSGTEGLVIRHTTQHRKGSRFDVTGPALCANAEACAKAAASFDDDKHLDLEVDSHDGSDHKETQKYKDRKQQTDLCVMMTCWPRIEAYLPHGPDFEALESYQQLFSQIDTAAELQIEKAVDGSSKKKNEGRDKTKRRAARRDRGWLKLEEEKSPSPWAAHEHVIWPVLPAELEDLPVYNPVLGLPHTKALDLPVSRSGFQRETNTSDTARSHQNSSAKPSKRRGAYLTFFPELTKAILYCEHLPVSVSDSEPFSLLLSTDKKQKQKQEHNRDEKPETEEDEKSQSLQEAVRQARREHKHAVLLRGEDAAISVWNHCVKYAAMWQWISLMVGSGMYLFKS